MRDRLCRAVLTCHDLLAPNYPLAGGTGTEILAWLDDRSRLVLHLTAQRRVIGLIVLAGLRAPPSPQTASWARRWPIFKMGDVPEAVRCPAGGVKLPGDRDRRRSPPRPRAHTEIRHLHTKLTAFPGGVKDQAPARDRNRAGLPRRARIWAPLMMPTPVMGGGVEQ